MGSPDLGLFVERRRSDWVRLRTLIVLRWIAIVGQLSAIVAAQQWFDLTLDLGLCYIAVSAAVIANLVSIFLYPENTRLSEEAVLFILLFDITQLSVLLYLTGGLSNPFALLILAPVTISASALQLRSTLVVGAIAIAQISVVTLVHVPLRTTEGVLLEIPGTFVFGFWMAIVIGIIFLALYAHRVTSEVTRMADALFATQVALSREQKLTDLGGVVAAAAHELGTPLATIKLASTELIEALETQSELLEDAQLIRDQADRCRDILRSMGRSGKSDAHLRSAPLVTVIRDAAEPHANRGKTLIYDVRPAAGGDERQPTILRRAEVIHGLRNLIQNAVDFSKSKVWIDASWSDREISIRITDDGPGFPPQVIGRIGDPFVRIRRQTSDQDDRPEYEGMGLGLFIAKTLLERSGAEVSFANGVDGLDGSGTKTGRRGAVVLTVWPRSSLALDERVGRAPLGANLPIAR